ncbi:MAG: hypothetical protein V2J13_09845 [Cycloclasticus sp.]|jgi:hypothetical protein|nr:MAG: hypothetical protein AXW16_06180 [Cycloclasticus sp. Phe_18]MEE4292036.1 hypothetical protein [Cycloclasticus sp.]
MVNDVNALERLKTEPMSVGQWVIVAICIGTLALDGYDVLSIAFAAPGITQEWGISKSVLGIVLSIELAGMSGGAIFLGSFADSRGRRFTMLDRNARYREHSDLTAADNKYCLCETAPLRAPSNKDNQRDTLIMTLRVIS